MDTKWYTRGVNMYKTALSFRHEFFSETGLPNHAFSENVLLPGSGRVSNPYFRPISIILLTSGSPSGGVDPCMAGEPASRKNFSNPPGLMMTTTLLGEVPTFLKACTVPLGTKANAPALARVVPSPSSTSTSLSTMYSASSTLGCKCGGGPLWGGIVTSTIEYAPRRWPRLPASPRSGLLPAIPIRLRRGEGGYLFGSQTYSILLRFSETIFTHLCNVVHEYSVRVTSGSKVK